MTDISAPPESTIDLWSDEGILDPYPLYRQLRDIPGAVWLPKYEMFILTRYADVREALEKWHPFSSAHGVMMNQPMNEVMRGILLCSDPPLHDQLRGVARRPLMAKEIKALEPDIQAEAEQLVERLVEQGTFDAATDLAQHLPVTIVSNLVGLPEEGRENMLDWAAANFNCFGPMNERAQESFPILQGAVEYSSDPTLRERLKPGGWAARLFEAADHGELPLDQPGKMLNDYWAPSLDTTILAITSAVRLFGEHPDQWDIVRENPSLIPHAFNEVVRLESPIQNFSRLLVDDYEVDGVTMRSGARVVVSYGSANRDERKWEDPERFDVTRKPTDHLAFGFGEHQCMGMPLARLEARAVLAALAKRVARFELGEREPLMNNILHGLTRLEVTVRPA
jgi:cytochrome P450